MLRRLHIVNYALIEDLTVDFGAGLNVLTGETGAGKSIILDAMACILGARASSEAIRTGCTSATIEALFDVSDNQEALTLLSQLGYEGPELLISREISINERNSCRINGRLATVAILQQLAPFLVELHGQHEHRKILTENTHLSLLDEFGVGGEACREVEQAYDELYTLTSRLEELRASERERMQKIDLLRFQVDEIDNARLKDGEEDILQQERRVLGNAERLQNAVASSYRALYEDEELSAFSLLGQALTSLEEGLRVDEGLKEIFELLQNAAYQLEEASRDLRTYRDNLEIDPDRLEEVEKRLELISQLKRKYGDSIGEILAFRREAAAELDSLLSSEQQADSLLKRIDEKKRSLGKAAAQLSKQRKEAAIRLTEALQEELVGLNMPHCRFEVEFLPVKGPLTAFAGEEEFPVNRAGFEQARFLISPNPGEELKPLSKIASGGEASRIVLALKSILARGSSATLVFDEIDTGIGGRTAEAVALRLKKLALVQQVLCVTHLPVVAAQADVHYFIEKEVVDRRTRARVVQLAGEGRLAEIVRMLGGKDTAATRQHAAMLLAEAKGQ